MATTSEAAQRRIWTAFVGVRAFLRHGLWQSLEGKTVVEPMKDWGPILEAVRVADEEELHVAPQVTSAMRDALRGIERDLNAFLAVVQDYIANRDACDEAHWLERFNAALDTARGNFQAALDRLKPLLATPGPGRSDGAKPLSVLFVAADPSDEARLRLGREFREIQETLRLSSQRDRFRLELPQLSLRPEDLSQALLDTQPAIVHFAGHGGEDGVLCFEDAAGLARPVDAQALALLFSHFTGVVECVVLNACYSELQARAMARHVPHVVGMGDEIGDDAALAFTVGFYQALGAGRAVDEAYRLGCAQIAMQGWSEQGTPVLLQA